MESISELIKEDKEGISGSEFNVIKFTSQLFS